MIRNWDIYSYYDKDDILLYIGISDDTLKRQNQHLGNPDNIWKDLFTKQLREKFVGTRGELLQRESYRIKNEQPKHNKTYNRVNNFIQEEKYDKINFWAMSDECVEDYWDKAVKRFLG